MSSPDVTTALLALQTAAAPPCYTFRRRIEGDLAFTPYDTTLNGPAGATFFRALNRGLESELWRYFRRNPGAPPRSVLLVLREQPDNLLQRKLDRLEKILIHRWGRHAPWGLLDEAEYVVLVGLPQGEALAAIVDLLDRHLHPEELYAGRLTLDTSRHVVPRLKPATAAPAPVLPRLPTGIA